MINRMPRKHVARRYILPLSKLIVLLIAYRLHQIESKMRSVALFILSTVAIFAAAVLLIPTMDNEGERATLVMAQTRLLIAKKIAALLYLTKPKKLYAVPVPLPLPIPIFQKNRQVLVKEPKRYPVVVPEPVPYPIPVPEYANVNHYSQQTVYSEPEW